MSTADIKVELQKLIEQENDLDVLEAIKTLLKKTSQDHILKQKLTSRALASEKDIKEENVWNRQEIAKKIHERLGL